MLIAFEFHMIYNNNCNNLIKQMQKGNIMSHLLKFIRQNKNIVIMTLLFCFVVFFPFLFLGKKFEIATDQQLQYHLFYEEWIRLIKTFIKTGEFPFFSWYTFLGTDYWASKAYYLTADIFLPLILVATTFFGKAISGVMLYITMFLVILSAINMRSYLNAMNIKNNRIKDIIAFVYAVSGIVTLYYGNYMFHRFYAFMPLLFIGVEKYLKCKKLSFFAIMVSILFMQNYYFMFPTSIFLIGYYISSYLSKKKENILVILRSAVPLIGAYLVGLLIASIVIIPTVIYMTGNARIGTGTSGFLWDLRVYVGFLFSYFTPPFNIWTSVPYIFYSGFDAHGYWYSLYTSVFALVVLLNIKHIKKTINYPMFYFYLLCIIVILVKPTSSIVHGFSGASFRWAFLLVFLQLLIVATFLDNANEMKYSFKRYSLYVTVSIIGLIVLNYSNFGEYLKHQTQLMVAMIGIVVGYLYLYLLNKKKLNILFTLVFLEMTIVNSSTIALKSSEYYYYDEQINKEYVDYFLNTEVNQLQRIYISPKLLLPTSDLNLNQAIHYSYMSTTSYDSTYAPALTEFLSWQFAELYNVFDLSNPIVLQMLGVKYIGVYKEESLPTFSDGYTYSFDLNAFKMYEMNNYNSIAHTYTDFISKSEFMKIADKSQFSYNDILIVNDENMDDVSDLDVNYKKQFQVYEHTNNWFNGQISVDNNSVLFVATPYSSGWRVVDDNNQSYSTISVNGGFLGVVIPKGTTNLSFRYITPGFKIGAVMSGMGILSLLVMIYIDRKIIKKTR